MQQEISTSVKSAVTTDIVACLPKKTRKQESTYDALGYKSNESAELANDGEQRHDDCATLHLASASHLQHTQ